jgi:hypothetical protein
MLGLPNADRNGARRVNDAIDWLAEHKFIVSERRRGSPGGLQLLSQIGDGGPYKQAYGTERYISVPLGVWQYGWIVRLSGTALALLIILLDMQGGRAVPPWISPAQARKRYDLSADTWTKGVHELVNHGLVSVTRRPLAGPFDYRRLRNAYQINEEELEATSATAAELEQRPTAATKPGSAPRRSARPK